MEVIWKILATTFALALALIVRFFKFVIMVGGNVLIIASVLVAILSIAAMFFSGFWNGLA